MKVNIDELKEKIASCLDETDFLDILGYTIVDLVDFFEEEIVENIDEFEKAVR